MRRLGIPRLRNGGCKHVVCRPKPASNRNVLNTPNGSQAPRARAGKAGRRASLPHASALPGHALTGPSTARHSSRSGRCLVRPDTSPHTPAGRDLYRDRFAGAKAARARRGQLHHAGSAAHSGHTARSNRPVFTASAAGKGGAEREHGERPCRIPA